MGFFNLISAPKVFYFLTHIQTRLSCRNLCNHNFEVNQKDRKATYSCRFKLKTRLQKFVNLIQMLR